MADKLTGESGSWFKWKQWQKMLGLGSIPTIERKYKEVGEYDRHRMGHSQQKGTWNNTVVPSGIGSL